MSRALIIGHSGQDGRILWDQLAARGYALLGISRTGFRCQGIDWVQPVDIGDPDDLCALVRELRPSQAYYLAAHHHSSQEPGAHVDDVWRRSWAVHVHGLQHLLEAVRTGSPECRTFYAASSRIFGAGDGSLVDEGTPRRPEDAYGVTKAAGMLVAEHYRRTHGQFVSCGILFNHESPLRGEQFVTQRVVKRLVAIAQGRAGRLEVGSLEARADWGYAPDYTLAMQAILEYAEAGDFVVATGETHSVRDLVEVAADRLGIAWRGRVIETGGILQRASQGLRGDASKLRQATGWSPRMPFPDMVRTLVDAAVSA